MCGKIAEASLILQHGAHMCARCVHTIHNSVIIAKLCEYVNNLEV